jgi:hypothetical protein
VGRSKRRTGFVYAKAQDAHKGHGYEINTMEAYPRAQTEGGTTSDRTATGFGRVVSGMSCTSSEERHGWDRVAVWLSIRDFIARGEWRGGVIFSKFNRM